MSFSPAADFLAASSWDNQVRIWEVQPNGSTVPKSAIQHDGPALCTAWSPVILCEGIKIISRTAANCFQLEHLSRENYSICSLDKVFLLHLMNSRSRARISLQLEQCRIFWWLEVGIKLLKYFMNSYWVFIVSIGTLELVLRLVDCNYLRDVIQCQSLIH